MLSMIAIMRSIMNAMETTCIKHELNTKEDTNFNIEFETEYGVFQFKEQDTYIVLSYQKHNCFYILCKFSFTEYASTPDEKGIDMLGSFKKIFVQELIRALDVQFRRNVG